MVSAGISTGGRSELARLTRGGRRLVTVEDAASALELDRSSAAKKLARWTQEGWLRRVRRGLYIPVPVDAPNPRTWTEDPRVLADAAWSPCYFTGWTAANHWALTEQVFTTTVVKTSARVRHSKQTLADAPFLVTHVAPQQLEWGLATVWHQEIRLRYADEARTVIDILDDPRLGGGVRHVAEILDAYLVGNDPEKLIDYGDRLDNGTVFKRLGLLVERLGLEATALVEACKARLTSGVTSLDPGGPAGGSVDSAWGLRVNVSIGPGDVG
ncbi:MAG TPA: type IV toxin-antitoxin system AbiEi family antitoxin domain-containing protein [Nitriliruptorales bacterium]